MHSSLIFSLSLLASVLAQNIIYEAEDAILNGTAVDNSVAGFTGTGYVTGFFNDLDSLSFNVSIANTGNYDLYITYQASFGDKYTALSLNGASLREVYFPSAMTFTTITGGKLSMVEGYNLITFASDWGWYSIDKIAIAPAAAITAAAPFTAPGTFEAEDAILNGTTVDSSATGYSGTGYVTGFTAAGNYLLFNISSPMTGLYDFVVSYSAPYGEKYTAVALNGASSGEVHFIETSNFTTASGGQLLLNEGYNTISFTTDWGWYLIDSITLSVSASPAPHQVSGSLNNPNATDAAKTLIQYLTSQYGKHILSGQQDPFYYA
jgi:mannan endo-1,4-beta-mannosidase